MRQVVAAVAAGILPAVEPGFPARRKKTYALSGGLKGCEPLMNLRFVRAAGCHSLRQARCLTLRGEPFAVGLVVAVPAAQGGIAGVGKQKLQRWRFNVAVAKHHVEFALMPDGCSL